MQKLLGELLDEFKDNELEDDTWDNVMFTSLVSSLSYVLSKISINYIMLVAAGSNEPEIARTYLKDIERTINASLEDFENLKEQLGNLMSKGLTNSTNSVH